MSKFARVLPGIRIGGVRLAEAVASARIRNAAEAGDGAVIRIDDGARLEGMPDERGTFFVHAMVQARVSPASPKGEDFVFVKGVFELVYQCPKDLDVTRAELEAFAASNAVFNAWPYFREYVHTMTVRMGLPPIVLPLFRVRADSTAKATPKAKPSVGKRRKATRG